MDKKKLETTSLVPAIRAESGIAPSANTVTMAPKAKTAINPAGISQSYYTAPTNATNYDVNKPIYTASEAVQMAGQAVADHEANKPEAYQSAYSDRIQSMIDNILNREQFSYDFATDPLYQQYAQQYQRGGQLAMKDAMAESAALTGGYGNSYAQQVGQQTYQRYMEDLGAMIPQLQQAAYDMYRDQGDTMRANLGMLQGADDIDYGRHRDNVGDYQDMLNYLYGKFSDMSQQEYNHYLNDVGSWEADRAYWYQREMHAAAAAAAAAAASSGGGSSRSSSTSTTKAQKAAATSAKNVSTATGNALTMAAEELLKKKNASNDSWVAGYGPSINKKQTMQTRK